MNARREMPKYECHKKVWALKIAGIIGDQHGGVYFQPAEEGYDKVPMSPEYVVKHKPEVGGYYVVYEDGYKSFSPAGAFESGYTAEVVRAATPSQPTTKTHDLLSTLIGLFLGAKERIGYKPGSVIDKIIAEAVEHLRDWPNETQPVTPYTSDPSGTAVQDAKEPSQ